LDDVVEARIKSLPTDSLIVSARAGHLALEKDHGVTHLDFDGKNESTLQATGLESLQLSLYRSKAELKLYLGKIAGQIVNNSEVVIPTKSGEMNLTKDKTSKISVEDQM
jgi:hypothetical protein